MTPLILKRFTLAAVLTAGFTLSTFAQPAATAYVPFVVNVDAAVSVVGPAGENPDIISIPANTEKMGTLLIFNTASVLKQNKLGGTSAVMTNSRGRVTLNLPAQTYQTAEVSLYTVNGRVVMRSKIFASESVKGISRSNLVAGVYLLSVKGVNGSSFSNRITHKGGALNINVYFGGFNDDGFMKKAESGSFAFDITVSAEGFADSSYTLWVSAGENDLQKIVLRQIGRIDGKPLVYGGQTYRTVIIGGKQWMAENLNYAGSGGSIGACYKGSSKYCGMYGRLYTWSEAMGIDKIYDTIKWDGSDVNHQGICPNGWHLPSHDDWAELETYVGSNAGTKLKSRMGWNTNRGYIAGTDNYGFSALPGGNRNSIYENFVTAGDYGFWWSATQQNADDARRRGIYYNNNNVDNSGWSLKDYALSVRCVKD